MMLLLGARAACLASIRAPGQEVRHAHRCPPTHNLSAVQVCGIQLRWVAVYTKKYTTYGWKWQRKGVKKPFYKCFWGKKCPRGWKVHWAKYW